MGTGVPQGDDNLRGWWWQGHSVPFLRDTESITHPASLLGRQEQKWPGRQGRLLLSWETGHIRTHAHKESRPPVTLPPIT